MTELTALVGRSPAFGTGPSAAEPVLLEQGFVMIPVGEAAWDVIGGVLADDPDLAGDLGRFLRLLMDAAGVRAEADGSYAYLEANDYKQSAIVGSGAALLDSYVTEFDGSEKGIPPRDWALNRALREIGVRVGDVGDECTAVGLRPHLD